MSHSFSLDRSQQASQRFTSLVNEALHSVFRHASSDLFVHHEIEKFGLATAFSGARVIRRVLTPVLLDAPRGAGVMAPAWSADAPEVNDEIVAVRPFRADDKPNPGEPAATHIRSGDSGTQPDNPVQILVVIAMAAGASGRRQLSLLSVAAGSAVHAFASSTLVRSWGEVPRFTRKLIATHPFGTAAGRHARAEVFACERGVSDLTCAFAAPPCDQRQEQET